MPSPSLSQRHASRAANYGLVSGVLLGLSFPPTDWDWLAWVALAPLGVVFCSPAMTARSWAGVYLGGLLCHLWVFDWMRTLYGGVGLAGDYLSCWLISGQLGALLFCLLVVVGRRCVWTAKLPVSIALPLAWMSYEALQLYVTALCNLAGSQGLAGTQLLSLALTQAEQTLVAQIADLGGAGLISLTVAAVNGFCYDAVDSLRSAYQGKRPGLRTAQLAILPLLLVALLVYGNIRLQQQDSQPGPTVCLMGPDDLPPLLVESRLLIEETNPPRATESAVADLLVWPELAYHHDLVTLSDDLTGQQALNDACPLASGDVVAYSQTVRQYLERAASKFQTSLLIGCQRLESSEAVVRRYNCLSYVDPVFGLRDRYDKRHLAPLTESTPWSGQWLPLVNPTNYTPGEAITPIVLYTNQGTKKYQVGCALCYDVAFSAHFRQLQCGGIAFFVVSGSEAADATGCLSTWLLRMAQLRAIETRRPIVRNTHRGFSSLIDANGRVVQIHNRQPLAAPWQLGAVPLDSRTSLFSQCGDWVFPACLGLLGIVLIGPLVSAHWSSRVQMLPGAYRWRPTGSRRLSAAKRSGFSLLELMAVVAIIGTITALLIPKVGVSAAAAKAAADGINRAKINAAVERWYLEKDVWPAIDLSDLGADPNYFPNGIPDNPMNNLPYSLNPTTHRVIDTGGGFAGK